MGRLVALVVTVGTIGYTPKCYQWEMWDLVNSEISHCE